MSYSLPVLFSILFFVGFFTQPSYVASASSPTIDPALVASLFNKASVNIILSFHDKARQKQTLSSLASKSFISRTERINAVANTLREIAAQSQQRVLTFLDTEKQERSAGISVESLWITNEIVIQNAGADLVHRLGEMPEISSVHEDQLFKLDDPIPSSVSGNDADAPSSEAPWGVVKVGATLLWEQGIRGQGIVIGTIDTGVRHTHDELRDNFVGPYGWFDPNLKSSIPNDHKGHGTHVTAIAVGNGPRKTGVAPDSKWMACVGCGPSGCTEAHVKACGQFMVCPTDPKGDNPDCSKAPHVINNSWSRLQGSPFFAEMVETWQAAHIVPVFTAGNLNNGDPDVCGTVRSPADYENVIGVGATDEQDLVAPFSRIGPTVVGQRLKPDVVAPGGKILSAGHKQDDMYKTAGGTSQAAPHVAGVVALLLSEYGNLTYSEIKTALEQGCVPTTSSGKPTCNGRDGTTFPNYHAGYGRIDAARSLEVLRKMYPKK